MDEEPEELIEFYKNQPKPEMSKWWKTYWVVFAILSPISVIYYFIWKAW